MNKENHREIIKKQVKALSLSTLDDEDGVLADFILSKLKEAEKEARKDEREKMKILFRNIFVKDGLSMNSMKEINDYLEGLEWKKSV